MKKIFLLLSLQSFFFGGIIAQQIPNGSFENWTTVGTTLELDNWVSFNSFTANYPTYGTLRTTDAYDGQYALKLKSGVFDLTPFGFAIMDTSAIAILGEIGTSAPEGIAFAHRPLKLSFYYKYEPSGTGDTAAVRVRFKKLGNKIGRGDFEIFGNAISTYTYQEITINWNSNDIPDTMEMSLTSGLSGVNLNSDEIFTNQIGNTLLLDKLVFLYSNVGLNDQESAFAFSIYPNPAHDMINVNIDRNNNTSAILNIYNVMGALVRTESLKQNQQQINIRDLDSGMYMLEVKSDNFSKKQKLIIQR